MSARVFNNLMESLTEAGGILRGEITDYRSFVVGKPAGSIFNALAVYVGGDEELISGKIYDVSVLSSGNIRTRDENDETVICDKNDFLIVKFQPKAEKLLRQLIAA